MGKRMGWVLIGVAALLVVGMVVFTYSFPKTIHVAKQAVVFTDDIEAEWKTTTVTIQGTLYRPLFKKDSFEGTLRIEGFPFTYEQHNFSMYLFEQTNDVNWGTISYVTLPNSSGQSTIDMYTGQIYFTNNLESFNIIAYEKWFDSNERQTFYIVSGSTLEDARMVQQMQSEKTGTKMMLANRFE